MQCRRDISSCVRVTKSRKMRQVRDLVVNTPADQFAAAMAERNACVDGSANALVLAQNMYAPYMEDAVHFWHTFDFAVPAWLLEMLPTDARDNRLEFHENANIDTVWAKIFGHRGLHFHHVLVDLCVFDSFVATIRRLASVCHLLHYGCICDRFRRQHVHFILVARSNAHVHTQLCALDDCSVTRLRDEYTSRLTAHGMQVQPCWPDHCHVQIQHISRPVQLFNTIAYVSNRRVGSRCPAINAHAKYAISNVVKPVQQALADAVHAFIASYRMDAAYQGSHHHIFRPIYPHAAVLFSALWRRGGIGVYVTYCMKRRWIGHKMKHVVAEPNGNLCLAYADIMEYLPRVAIPLRNGDHLYHTTCLDGQYRSRRDDTRYLHLSRSESMHLAVGSTACCEGAGRDIFFANMPRALYRLDDQKRREFRMYLECTRRRLN